MVQGGTAVGFAYKYTACTYLGTCAVAWGLDGVPIDLNTLLSPIDAALWTLTDARSISDTNWVTGLRTYDPDGIYVRPILSADASPYLD